MNRRNFLTTLGTQGLILSGLGPLLAVDEKRDRTHYGTNNKSDFLEVSQQPQQKSNYR